MKKNQKPQWQARQGDVLVERIETANISTEEPREKGRVILAHGEITGHCHAITEPGVRKSPFRREDGIECSEIEVKAALAELRHEEHGTVKIPQGDHRVTRQREYHPTELRNVAD
jgi:hypothetical protein